MSLFTRFFGGSDADDRGAGELAANPEIKHPLSLQVLFPRALEIDEGELMKAFRAYHSSVSKARCEIDPNIRHDGNLFGMVGWGEACDSHGWV